MPIDADPDQNEPELISYDEFLRRREIEHDILKQYPHLLNPLVLTVPPSRKPDALD